MNEFPRFDFDRPAHDRAVKVLGHTGITDVTVLMGFYTAVSLTVAFYSVPSVGAAVMVDAKPVEVDGKELGTVYPTQQKGDKQ